MTNVLMRALIADKDRLKAIEGKLAKTILKIRQRCRHEHIVAVEYRSFTPPFRVCEDCGAQEQEWHCGLHVLLGANDSSHRPRVPYQLDRFVRVVSFDEAMKIRYTFPGGIYRVGQNHPNFKTRDWSYKNLNKAYIPE